MKTSKKDDKVFLRAVGRVYYYEGGFSRLDGEGSYRVVSDQVWRSIFGEGVGVSVVKSKASEKGFGVGRPRSEGVVGLRAMQKRRLRDGNSNPVGRPRRGSEDCF